MKVVIAGGHGHIALLLEDLLSGAGHEVAALIRDARQAPDLEARGAKPIVLDLTTATVDELAARLDGVDAVVFAAGAGAGSTTLQKEQIDRGGAILLADAAEAAGVDRYVLVSSMGTDRFDPDSNDPFQIYLRMKAEADDNIRARAFDWTIVRPSGLTDAPGTGSVRIGDGIGGGSIPREDVAALLLRILADGIGSRVQFEVTSGTGPIATLSL